MESVVSVYLSDKVVGSLASCLGAGVFHTTPSVSPFLWREAGDVCLAPLGGSLPCGFVILPPREDLLPFSVVNEGGSDPWTLSAVHTILTRDW